MTPPSTPIEVMHGDIAAADADVLVNASNTGAWLGSGVSAAIARSCGAGFQDHIRRELVERFKGDMEPGEAFITDAGTHPRAKWIAHVAVMDYRDGHEDDAKPTLERIERGTRRMLDLLEELPAASLSLAMVALGRGTGGLGLRDSVRISARALRDHLAVRSAKIAKVLFVGWSFPDYANMLDEVRQFFPIDLSKLPDDLQRFLAAVHR